MHQLNCQIVKLKMLACLILYSINILQKNRPGIYNLKPSKNEEIPQYGTATFNTNVNIRDSPSINGEIKGGFKSGESTDYDHTVDDDYGRTWLSFLTAKNERRYACAIDSNGKCYVSISQ